MGGREIRIRDDGGAFRVIYIVRTAEAVYILHAFQKKTQQTAKHDLDLVATGLGGEPPQTNLSLWGGVAMERQVDVQEFANVWDALTDTPEESANMTMRADLLIALQQKIAEWGLTQVEAAKKLGVTQPRLSDLLRGRIEKFSLDMLINLALQAGLSVRLEIAA